MLLDDELEGEEDEDDDDEEGDELLDELIELELLDTEVSLTSCDELLELEEPELEDEDENDSRSTSASVRMWSMKFCSIDTVVPAASEQMPRMAPCQSLNEYQSTVPALIHTPLPTSAVPALVRNASLVP